MRETGAVLLLVASLHAAWVRQPDAWGAEVVFAAAGELWVVSLAGGTARRLVELPGEESVPRWSPDGRHIAFSAVFEGNREVYVIDASGGEPRRLTWHPGSDEVLGWDGDRILFRNRRDGLQWEAWSVPASGGGAEPTGLPAAWLVIEPGTGRRAWASTDASWLTWDGYRGGMAPELRLDGAPLASSPGSGSHPAWQGGRLWCLDADTSSVVSMSPGEAPRVEARVPGARHLSVAPQGGVVVATGAGELWRVVGGRPRRVDVRLPLEGPGVVERPAREWVEALHPDGDALLAVVRGDLWRVDAAGARPLLERPASRETSPSRLADGRLLFVTDEGGEEVLALADTRGRVRRLAHTLGPGWLDARPSPDGSEVAGIGRDGGLWRVGLEGGSPVRIARAPWGTLASWAWGPDGSLAWAQEDPRGLSAAWWCPRGDTSARRLTERPADDRAVAFLGDRLVALRVEGPLTFDARDVEAVGGWEARLVVLDPREGRASPLPGDPGDWRSVVGGPGGLVLSNGETLSGWKDGVVTPLGLVAPWSRVGDTFVRLGGADLEGTSLRFADAVVRVDRAGEWRQMVLETGRIARDSSPWPERGEAGMDRARRVSAELGRLHTREDFAQALGWVLGAVGGSHTYAMGGDLPPRPRGAAPGLLGADFVADAGAWRAWRVFDDGATPPALAVGDRILGIDGSPVDPRLPPEATLLGRAGEQVVLRVRPASGGPDRELVLPVRASDRDLRRADQDRRARAFVEAESGGRLTYVRLADMAPQGLAEFDRWFRASLGFEGLVLDLRGNGGGWLADPVYHRLARAVRAGFTYPSGVLQPWPLRSHRWTLVVLVDGQTQSEAEVLAAGVRAGGLGKLVGSRTWGGASGGNEARPLVDGTTISVTGALWTDTEGTAIENRGVLPDIVLDGDPLGEAVRVALQRDPGSD